MPKIDKSLHGPYMMDLRGKQSVRATFKISQKAIDSIGLVAIHLGIKQKSLFDHIIEDAAALDSIARKIRIRQFKKIPRRQKTFVLSRKTIDTLASISDAYGMPRDALVEYSVMKLDALINAEKKRHVRRKKMLEDLDAHFNKTTSLLQEARQTLGKNDPYCRRLEKAVLACRKSQEEIHEFIEKSKMLEDY